MGLKKIHLLAILAIFLLMRLLSLGLYPLMDTTEARYGEMARLMVETGNWLTPQFDYNVPFWGKPPLFTWMSALGLKLFGQSEFAIRFPHWLAGLVTIGMAMMFASYHKISPLLTGIVLATCGMFFISSGAVMTDMALTLSITVTILSFYLCWNGKKAWGYAGFVGLGIGLLAKGPVAIVLAAIAFYPFLAIQHGPLKAFVVFWKRFPVITGTLLMLGISLPWYLMAEKATPGFLDYFIIGEHWKRFTLPGWEGDLYGSAHDRPRGMIWLFGLLSALPWSLILPMLLWKKWKSSTEKTISLPPLAYMLLFWLISPMILFTFAGNILPTYVLPGLPALGLICAGLLTQKDEKWFVIFCKVMPAGMLIGLLVVMLTAANTNSDKILFETADNSVPAFYIRKRPFSGQFYSNGKAIVLTNSEQLNELDSPYYLLGKKKDLDKFFEKNKVDCRIVAESPKRQRYLCE